MTRPGQRALWAAAALALALLAAPAALAQSIVIDLGSEDGGGGLSGRVVQLFLLITVLGIAPGLAVTVTCFPFILTVLSILRQGIGLQQAPPNMLIVSLSLFLTWYVMDPVFAAAWADGLGPFVRGETTAEQAIGPTVAPFRAFMAARVQPDTYLTLASLRPPPVPPLDDAPLSVLVPAFLLGEIQRAFEIGFLIFLPFLIIDLVTSAVLMSMGMMMVPPAVVALPFKLAFFVVADGWTLVAAALVRSYQ